MILASLEIYSLWLYGHSKQHCRSSQVLSLVHSVVYILVELIIYYVSLNIFSSNFYRRKYALFCGSYFMKKPILLADGIFVDFLLYYGAGNKSILFGFYYFAYCHQEDRVYWLVLFIVQTLYHKILPWRHHISYC